MAFLIRCKQAWVNSVRVHKRKPVLSVNCFNWLKTSQWMASKITTCLALFMNTWLACLPPTQAKRRASFILRMKSRCWCRSWSRITLKTKPRYRFMTQPVGRVRCSSISVNRLPSIWMTRTISNTTRKSSNKTPTTSRVWIWSCVAFCQAISSPVMAILWRTTGRFLMKAIPPTATTRCI